MGDTLDGDPVVETPDYDPGFTADDNGEYTYVAGGDVTDPADIDANTSDPSPGSPPVSSPAEDVSGVVLAAPENVATDTADPAHVYQDGEWCPVGVDTLTQTHDFLFMYSYWLGNRQLESNEWRDVTSWDVALFGFASPQVLCNVKTAYYLYQIGHQVNAALLAQSRVYGGDNLNIRATGEPATPSDLLTGLGKVLTDAKAHEQEVAGAVTIAIVIALGIGLFYLWKRAS